MRKKFLIIAVISITATACATPPTLEPRPKNWAKLIKKDSNFYQVDTQLFRSEQLLSEDMNLLKSQDIKTIINLRYFNRDENEEHFDNQSFTLINRPLKTWAVTPEQLAKILLDIDNQQKLGKKVLVHCYHGSDRTGIVIAMYRIIQQNWTIEQAKQEMLQGGYGFHNVWKNLPNLLTEDKVNQVRQAYLQLKNSNEHNQVGGV
ncbi:dual specificity protein phosphatase family protein [Faucicola boevrei]|uniref:dual specificity protein phosphatase family protein n=1 Tax=Faucicola boevrei TaxID=346665 RepID=UPI00036C5524|nr:dual specificity protein phosphatase family protein [Moraxella boevrei]